MGYYWDDFFRVMANGEVFDPETGNRIDPADLADLSPRDLIRLYTEWLLRKGVLR